MRCRWDDVPESLDARGWRQVACVRCGRTTKATPHPHERIFAECKSWPFPHELGHWLSLLLAAIGLNPLRYVWLKAKLGLQPKCGCGQREAALNTWGDKARRWLLRVLP